MSASSDLQVFRLRVPAGEGRAFKVARGNALAVVDVMGGQCTDFWAIDLQDYGHYFSPPHTIVHNQSIQLRVGHQLVTNLRRPILTVLSDDVGLHDMFYPPCDKSRYLLYFGVSEHRNCHDNFLEAVAGFNWGSRPVPFPALNIFMNTRVESDGRLTTLEPVSKPGDKIVFRAEMDILCVASSCPMDLTPLGAKGITDVEIVVAEDFATISQALGD